MVPYFPQPVLDLGPLHFHAFGACVGLGVVLGLNLCYRRAAEYGVSMAAMRGAMTALIAGFWASFVLEIAFYKPWVFEEEGLGALFSFSHGMSSYGGLVGAAIGLTVYHRIVQRSWMVQADILVQGFVLGWIFGRLGCTLAHDHQGALSDFFLATRYPGGARHNLGFYEFLYTLLLLFPVSIVLHRRFGAAKGLQGWAMAALYAPMRFGLDHLRSRDQSDSDARYFGLTFAQYCCIALIAYVVISFPKLRGGWRRRTA